MQLKKRQELFKLVQLIKAAPFRSVLAFVLLLPLFRFIAGYVLEFVLTESQLAAMDLVAS
jgi:hypothetical protein